jgi:hypothetical protein
MIFLYIATGKTKSMLPFCITKRDIIAEVGKWKRKHQLPFLDIQYEFEIRKKNSQNQPKVVTEGDNTTNDPKNTNIPTPLESLKIIVGLTWTLQ